MSWRDETPDIVGLLSPEEQELFTAASAAVIERVRRDQARSSDRLKPLLTYLIDGHLYDHRVNVQRWKWACGIRSNTINEHFQTELGLSPLAYLTDCRIETAARLLLTSQLKIWRLARIVGYSDINVFSRAFERQLGLRPSRFRRSEGSAPTMRPEVSSCVRTCRQTLAGGAQSGQAAELLDRLRALYPGLKDHQAFCSSEDSVPLGEIPERVLAERVWTRIKNYSWSEQRTLIRQQLCFRTPVLFDLLRRKSREHGRQDRIQGIQLAELALASLEPCAEALGADLPNRVAQGWIWLANARRLARDFSGAEQAFVRAEAELIPAAEHLDRLVRGEFCYYQANLKWVQRQHDQALELVNRALEVFQAGDESAEWARALILRAAIRRESEDLQLAINDLHAALELLDRQEDSYLRAAVYYHLTETHVRLSDFATAMQTLPPARDLCRKLGLEAGRFQLMWLEGLLRVGQGDESIAETAFREAYAGFLQLEESGYAAVCALDLALLLHQQGHSAEVTELAATAIPVLEAFQIRPEVLGALTLLCQALEAQAVTLTVLKQVRQCLSHLVQDPALSVPSEQQEDQAERPDPSC